ncbi:MAG: hypothetical protein GKR88_01575 [Flavobacteriaceae bacterium]|nr:MAG: hypothetical protein GKR88_01575 [Flavobacteriaceae bacterium]
MKYLQHLVIITVLAILVLGCANQTPSTLHSLTVAVDLSEADGFRPKADFILDRLESDNIFDGIEISYIPIIDTRYTERHAFTLSKSSAGWLSNEDSRRRSRRALSTQFRDTLAKYCVNDKPLKYSAIFGTIVTELNRLASKQGVRKLILISDLKEHSPIFSIYDPRQARRLLKYPKDVQARFESMVRLADNYKGINVELIHLPSPEEEQHFSAMVALYRAVIESRGGTLTIGNQKTVKL